MIPSYTLALSLAPTLTLTLTSQVVLRVEGLDRFANEIAQTKGTAGGAAAGGGAGGGGAGGGAGGGGAGGGTGCPPLSGNAIFYHVGARAPSEHVCIAETFYDIFVRHTLR